MFTISEAPQLYLLKLLTLTPSTPIPKYLATPSFISFNMFPPPNTMSGMSNIALLLICEEVRIYRTIPSSTCNSNPLSLNNITTYIFPSPSITSLGMIYSNFYLSNRDFSASQFSPSVTTIPLPTSNSNTLLPSPFLLLFYFLSFNVYDYVIQCFVDVQITHIVYIQILA